ncbi:two-component regulator propeller domain-containing protein [Psychroserpens sp. XS_ASV72]|uniref:sensor histidine kinase n=1 Tax=Psychroserpens sp. XS_ASV72 TaxID=3241293 RepID=UPI00351257DA
MTKALRFLISPFFFLGLIIGNITYAQNKQLRPYTLEDGLPQSQVYAISQDAKGYLWLGTQGGGLVCFDGEDFKVYNETTGLESNYINAIKASKDTLFLGTNKGVSLMVRNKIFNISGPKVNDITRFGNATYVLTDSGLYMLSNKHTLIKKTLNNEIDNSQINDLIYDGSRFWMATSSGLWVFKDMNEEVISAENLDANDYKSVTVFGSKVFAATFDDGTKVYNQSNMSEEVLVKEPLRINQISIKNSNQLWVCTDSNGISVIDTDSYEELFTINQENGLSTPHVRQTFTDRQGNIWIATSGGGLYKYFQNNFKHYNTDTGLNGNRVYAVHHNADGLWISNSEAGLMKINAFGIQDIDIPIDFSEVKIKTISSSINGNLWFGSDGRGLLFKGKIKEKVILKDSLKTIKKPRFTQREITKVLNSESDFPFDWIRQVHAENDTIWAATYASGIVKFSYQPEKDSLVIYNTYASSEGIEDLQIRHIQKDKKNRLWYVTQKGHLGYLKGNTITDLGIVLGQNSPINSIVFNNNSMFLGTAGNGVWRSNDTEFRSFKKLQGKKDLTSENVYQLIFDSQGYLWVGSERGVDKLELNMNSEIEDIFHFSRNDGFLGVETCLNAVDIDKNRHLWFGTIYGLTEYIPSENNQNTKTPVLFLEDVKVAYKSVDSINLLKSTNSEYVLQLQPNQRQVSFSFKTIDLDHPDGIEYRYKLNNDGWSPWTVNNTQDFSELNFGKHDFTVQSRNYRWIESNPLQFSFFIEKPLYRKSWFQWTLIGFALLVVATLGLQYVKRLKQKNEKETKQLQLENHLLSLEQKALRLQMNPHFIFNVLNGIKATASTKPEKMKETVNSFAALLRDTLNNSRKELISLKQEIKTLEHYIRVEQLMAEKPFTYDIDLDLEIDSEEILIPPMLIQPFVENAIRHGILKIEDEGKLTISFKTKEGQLEVIIQDNGIGIYQSQQQKQKADHQSMALKVTKERLESISGKNALTIQEIKQPNGYIKGTEISLMLPLETDY